MFDSLITPTVMCGVGTWNTALIKIITQGPPFLELSLFIYLVLNIVSGDPLFSKVNLVERFLFSLEKFNPLDMTPSHT